MYTVIFRSDSPIAKPFRRWVTQDLLPVIRMTGKYGILQTREELFASALIDAQQVLAEHAERIGGAVAPRRPHFR